MDIIDEQGYRCNVGIIIFKSADQLLLGRRNQAFNWQLPQGGVHLGESEQDAMYRELNEEVGLSREDVKLVYTSRKRYTYDIPEQYLRKCRVGEQLCIGQKQRWFLLRLACDDSHISLSMSETPEFSEWCWSTADETINMAIFFKRALYKEVIAEFTPYLLS